ncbi:glycosyltransferase family 4 protein [Terriglobus roseus]|uniref:Glycosyltransferase involved in cell wall bisynthesis n=1 Tax=Terriglobus roseus TaxID=392734 RepID=A0A1H4ITH4_9BACT|nr:glycosyltransferase family 4 protein [Terriglobus roseus]SEB37155.1 Glycosyltransferase involved in cell wall bisynthesis [Terriglobus roseus]
MDTQRPIEIFIPEVEAFGGAERSDLALSRWLYQQGIENRVLTYEDRVGLARYVQHPLEVIQLRPERGVRAKVAALKAHFAGQKQQSRLIVSGYQPALHATLAGARGFQCLMHDTAALLGDAGHRSLKGKLRLGISNVIIGVGLRSGGATVVTSEFLQGECRSDFWIKAKIARMGGLPANSGFRERPFDGSLNLLSVCRIEANKRIDWMLEALAVLEKEARPLSAKADWRLDVAGKGSLIESLQKQAQQLGIADRVRFLGFVSDEDLQSLMHEAHLFLMPAVQGFGIPAVEALQTGIPVLLHRESGVSDILRATPWATVFEGGPEAMVPALRVAIDNLIEGKHIGTPLPPISTEDEWAAKVAGFCGWC